MKMKKRLFSVILSACLFTAILAGCGSETASSTSSAGNSAAATEVTAETGSAAEVIAETESTAAAPASAALNENIVKILATDSVKIAYIPISTAGVTNKMVQMAFNDVTDPYKNTVTVDYFDPAYDVQTQITMVNNCVSQGYDCILLEAADPIALATPVDEAEAAGIPVITVNLKAATTYSMELRGVDYDAGWKAAEILANNFGTDTGLNVVIIDMPAAMLTTAFQSKGFIEYMEQNTNWNLVDQRCIDNFSAEGANTAVRDILTAHDDVDIIFNSTDDLTAGTIQAIRAAGKDDGSIIVYGNYGIPATFEDMVSDDGVLYGMNFFDYYNQYTQAMTCALYHAMTHATAQSMGLSSTPILAGTVYPVTRETAELYKVLSRWDMALTQD